MQVRYGSEADGWVWLTGTPWSEDAGLVPLSAEQLIQQDGLLRGASPFLCGRGNVVDTISVPVIRTFLNNAAALRHNVELPWILPNDGALEFYERDGATQVVKVVYETAAWRGVERKRVGAVGVSLVFNFVVAKRPAITTENYTESPIYIMSESGEYIRTE